MRGVSVQGPHQRRPPRPDPHTRVPPTLDPTLVALRQAQPTLQIEIVPDPFVLLLADEQAGEEAEHHRRHAVTDRILGRLEAIDQRLELLLPLRDVLGPGLQRRGYLGDHLDVSSDDLLLLFDFVETSLDASGQAAELLLGVPPFFAFRFRRSDSWTSLRASAIFKPGGCSGPP